MELWRDIVLEETFTGAQAKMVGNGLGMAKENEDGPAPGVACSQYHLRIATELQLHLLMLHRQLLQRCASKKWKAAKWHA